MMLNLERLRKVKALMEGGSTSGERASARARAEAMAKAAGMTLADAMSKLDATEKPKPKGLFEGFDDWMEQREPGYKAREAAKRAERNARDAQKRAEVLAAYGSDAALFARTERERLLEAAISSIATWEYWTDLEGVEHRYAKSLDGVRPLAGVWGTQDVTHAIRRAVMEAFPWPACLADALAEVKEWDRLGRERALFNGGEWNHYAEVECRIALLEDELESSRPAASWDDLQTRFNWKLYTHERAWIDPAPRNDPFLDRLEADVAFLRGNAPVHSGHPDRPPVLHRTTAAKRADVLSTLDAHPELSDREIARRVGVSPQTVNNHRRARKDAAMTASHPGGEM